MMSLWQKRNNKHRLQLGRYYCKRWNMDVAKKRSDKLASFKLIYMLEETVLPPEETAIKKVTLWTHNCFKYFLDL